MATVLAALPVIACGSSSSGDGASPASALDAQGSPPSCAGQRGPSGGGPSPRGDVAGALDATGEHLVVFGGDTAVPICGGVPSHAHVGDTFVLDVACGGWHAVAGDAPEARSRHAMVLDAARNRALLFGGRTRAGSSGAYTIFADTWAFDFAHEAWTKLETTGDAPPPRSNAAAVVDTKGKQLVVFGGSADTTGLAFKPLDDTYALDLESLAWRRIAPDGAPKARLFHAMGIDTERRVAYVYSGGDANAFTGPFLSDVWALDLAAETWTKLAPAAGPSPRPRINASAFFDTVARRLVVFGGHDDGQVGNQNDVWALDVDADPPAWSQVGTSDTFQHAGTGQCDFPADFTAIDPRSPERRSAFVAAPRADGRAMVVFGGKSDCGLLADAWWFSDGAPGWSTLVQSPVGLSCLRVQTTCTGLCG